MALLPQRLKAAADYYTVAIGKWHLGARQRANLPGRRGFDHHFGFLTGGEDHFTQVGYEAANAIDLWAADASDAAARAARPRRPQRHVLCELYAAEAARVVMAHDLSRPLFVPGVARHARTVRGARAVRRRSIAYADRRVMQAMVACVDEGTGIPTAALEARGMWENTLLVWSADNGGPQYWNANNSRIAAARAPTSRAACALPRSSGRLARGRALGSPRRSTCATGTRPSQARRRRRSG